MAGGKRGRPAAGEGVGVMGYLLTVGVACAVLQLGGLGVEGYTQEEVAKAGFDLNCGLGFTGLNCEQVVTCESHSYCNGHGVCKRGGECICDPGWRGQSCDSAYCPSNCTGHGTCMPDGSGCLCDSGFSGTICDDVACFGGGNCTGHGACLTGGICQCDQGYLGAGCDQVDVVLKCSNHGTVDANGDCVCSLWYTGPDCSLVLCMNNCSEHGACDTTSGKCFCDASWGGGDCSKRLCMANCSGHGNCFGGECSCQEGYTGQDCSELGCPNDCSEHGACLNGTCVCDLEWVLDDCSLFEPIVRGCPGNCTGRGTCLNNTCLCDVGWQGDDCALPVWCPGNCTGHGVCANSTCMCDIGYFGDDCGHVGCFNNCTQRGTCTSNGTCACDAGHFGADCSLTDLRCTGVGMSGNCSAHGSCVDAGEGQWWSGSAREPDVWAHDPGGGHLERQDTGQCLFDYYGLPGELLSGPPASWAASGGRRTLVSNGVPDHLIATEEGKPLCEARWQVSLPLLPAKAPGPTPLPIEGVIAFSLNGIPVWGAELSDGTNAVGGSGVRVPCYGHASSRGGWHYHHPLFGCDAAADQDTLLGYAIDGFPLYGPLEGSREEVDARLDPCNGRDLPDGSYRYHVRTLGQVDGAAEPRPRRNTSSVSPSGVRTDARADVLASTGWNYVLGCFSGTPATSLALRPIVTQIRTSVGSWAEGASGGSAPPPVRGTLTGSPGELAGVGTVAEQLGLVGRVGMCVCDPGWVGVDCETPGCSSNCTGHGTCLRLGPEESACECDESWMGDDCSMRFNGTCGDGCSGHGACLWPHQLNATCLCDARWGGLDCSEPLPGGPCAFNCSGRGSCFNGTCACDSGWQGAGCELSTAEAMSLNSSLCWQWVDGRISNNSCSGNGACQNGTCVCDLGWEGFNCSARVSLPPGSMVDCPNNCSFNGACTFRLDEAHNTYNGTCSCDLGWDGPDCSLYWGGAVCEHNCSEHGSCQNGTCLCDDEWTGDACEISWLSLFRYCPMNCSDHGACLNGTCTCDFGWLGENCSIPLPCPGDCSGNGVCVLGNCTCDPGFAGADCSHSDVCPGYLPERGVNCSGHGVCIGGNCSCDEGWGGFDCSEQGCLGSCSGHGDCVNGTCLCMPRYIGADCGQGPYGGECPGRCTGHGACSIVERTPLPLGVANVYADGLLEATIGCVCDGGWAGPDCSLRSCPNDCSGNGACAQNGSCFCYRYWGGDDCGEASCPNDCGGRGTCVGGVGCLCDTGFEGPECTQSACANNCSMQGVCVAGPGVEYGENKGEQGYDYIINTTIAHCDCFFGWGGIDCSDIVCPLNCSFPQGNCINGTCVCDGANGYFGQNCSEQFGIIGLRTDGTALQPSFGIFTGGSQITVKGTGFVNSDTMRCKFGGSNTLATLVQPTPPELPYAVCRTPAVSGPQSVNFQFSLDNIGFTEVDARVRFTYHGSGVLQSIKWPTAPAAGGATLTMTGFNFQFATATRCKFGDFVVEGTQTIYFVEAADGSLSQEGTLFCTVPPLAVLNLPVSASATVTLQVSMDAGASWMSFGADPSFKYYELLAITPSFGPQQDQVTQVRVHGTNLFQGLQMQDIFPGFSYAYACQFELPWETNRVTVFSSINTWVVRTAPYDGAYFSCTVPPGLATGGGYTGPVNVRISLNPCMTDSSGSGECVSALPFTIEPVTFYYASPVITSLSVSLGPLTGGTLVTVRGTFFHLRDTNSLPAGYDHLPVLCKWGEEVTTGEHVPADNTVLCTSPPCATPACLGITLDQCPDCLAPVRLEVALNGQDYTGTQLSFSYFKDPLVNRLQPTLGPTAGGTAITVFAVGFGDPCLGCEGDGCTQCLESTKCRFQAFDRVVDSPARCLQLPDGTCDRSQLVCSTPVAGVLRGNIVSLDPFFVAVSVSTNGQQFFPVKGGGSAFNVNDPACTTTNTVNCAFKFKFYEQPVITGIRPAITAGDGLGRITITGSNFLNVNDLRCRFGSTDGSKACQSGATDSILPCSFDGCCAGADEDSAIFVSSTTVICPTVNLRPTSPGAPLPTSLRVGLSLNGQPGPNDYVYLRNSLTAEVVPDALQVYWATSIFPSVGFNEPGTRVTVTGINFGAFGAEGDVQMRCKFGANIVVPNPTITVDPVNYQNGNIECTSPGMALDTAAGKTQELVDFGVCLVGSSCLYIGPERQGDNNNFEYTRIHHYTQGIKYLFYKAPVLNSLLPSLGPTSGGTHITVAGAGFFQTDVLKCRFTIGHFSTAATHVSSTQIVCVSPPMQPGSENMEVTINDQDYSAGCNAAGDCPFLVYTEPTIVTLKPNAGVNRGGTRVQLTVANAVPEAGQLLKCRFFPLNEEERLRTEVEGMVLEDNNAILSSSTVTCETPSSLSASNSAILKSPTASCPTCGLANVALTWNGQQFGYSEQQFSFHEPIRISSISPVGGYTTGGDEVTVFGENFVNTIYLVLQFGDNLFLCSPGAPATECPVGSTHVQSALTFVDSYQLKFTVPSSPIATRKNVLASNNNFEWSTTLASYDYYTTATTCPPSLSNPCRGNGDCLEIPGSNPRVQGCICLQGYSGIDCSVGPQVLRVEPSIGLASGGYNVIVHAINVAYSAQQTYRVRVGGETTLSATLLGPNMMEFRVPTANEIGYIGPSTVGKSVEITVNNQVWTSNSVLLRLMPDPVLSSIVPNAGHRLGGTTVTLNGQNFIDTDKLRLKIGSLFANGTTFVTEARIVATTRACIGDCGNFTLAEAISLTVNNGVSYTQSQITFRYVPDPELVLVTPNTGSTTGGTPTLVSGFVVDGNSLTCDFGGTRVAASYHLPTGSMVCPSPASASAGRVPVLMSNDGQVFSPPANCSAEPTRCFEYRPPVAITRVVPTLGPIGGQTAVTIVGTNFFELGAGQATCTFGSLTSNMVFVDEQHYTCLSPPTGAVGDVAFHISPNGVDAIGSGQFQFSYYVHPTLLSSSGDTLIPMGTPLSGGTSVTITGTNFRQSGDGIRVRFLALDGSGLQTVSGRATYIGPQEIRVVSPRLNYTGQVTMSVSVSLNDGLQYSPPAFDPFVYYKQPDFREIEPHLGPRLGETAVMLVGDGFVNLRGKARCRFGSQTVAAFFDDAGATPVMRCISPPSPVPTWVVVEVALDGQVFSNVKTVKFQYYGEFDVTSVVPAGGPSAGGTTTTVNGVGFFMSGTLLQCFFGDGTAQCAPDTPYPCYKPVPAIYVSPNAVTCVTPSIPPGGAVTEQYPVRLGINGEFSQACPNVIPGYACPLKAGLAFTYYSDVNVAKILPNSGQVMGGTRVTISGSNFRVDLDYATRCMFTLCTIQDVVMSGDNFGQFQPGKTDCSGETVQSAATAVTSTNEIVCVTPVAASADSHFAVVDVSLNRGSTKQRRYGPTCPDGCPVTYFFYSLPLLGTLNPALGPETGGTHVTIVGNGFIGQQNTQMKCRFGTVESNAATTGVTTSVQFLTQSTIKCVAPPQLAADVRMQVSLNGLEGDFTDAALGAVYKYHVAPTLTGVPVPSAGAAGGGTTITLTGTDFRPGLIRCKFWTTEAEGGLNLVTAAEYKSATQVTCPTPSVPSSQLVSISISLNAQDYSPHYLVKLFFFFPNPMIYQLVPRGGPAESGGSVLVIGEGFVNTTTIRCRFGEIPALGVMINSTHMRCQAPQIQRKDYSAEVLRLGVLPVEVLPDDFVAAPVQSYAVEVSFDAQTFTSSGVIYTYYPSPQVDLLTPSSGSKGDATVTVVLNGANFRDDIAKPLCRFGVGGPMLRASFLSSRAMMCRPQTVSSGQRVLVEVALNGYDFEVHKSAAYSFFGVAPVPVSAALSESYCELDVTFDVPTDKARTSGNFPCSDLLEFIEGQALHSMPAASVSAAHAQGAEGIFEAMFGRGTVCGFTNNMTLTVNIGNNGGFKLGQPLALRNGFVMRGKELTHFAKGNVTIANPFPLPKPSVKITMPTTIGVCDRLQGSATASSGGACRALYYTWSIDLQASRVTDDNLTPTQKGAFLSDLGLAISAYSGLAYDPDGVSCRHPGCLTCLARDASGACTLRSNTTYSDCRCDAIDVPFADLPMGYYAVFAVVTNWLGAQSDPAVVTVTKVVQPLPVVRIVMNAEGDTLDRMVPVNRTLMAGSSISPSPCDGSNSDLVIVWSVTRVSDGAAVAIPGDATAGSLSLPPFTLSPGVRYRLLLHVNVRGSDLYKATDSVQVVGTVSRPVAAIAGGVERTAGRGQDLTLDGTVSFHPDFAPGNQAAAGMTYFWECRAVALSGASGPCVSDAGLPFGAGTSGTLMVPAGTMKSPSGVGYYVFTLNVTSAAGGSPLKSSAATKVWPTDGALHQVAIFNSGDSNFVPNVKRTLASTVTGAVGAVAYQWTTVEGDVDVTLIQYTLTPATTDTLVIKPGVLTGGHAYTIRLTATAGGKQAFDQVSFVVKKQPRGGTLYISPASGTATSTSFGLEARAWEPGEDGALPLEYQFEYRAPVTNSPIVILVPFSQSSDAVSLLPPPTSGGSWQLRLRVRNAVGAETLQTECNGVMGTCSVPVATPSYVNASHFMAETTATVVTDVTTMLSSGSNVAAQNYINLLLQTLHSLPTQSPNGGRRLLALTVDQVAAAAYKCGTLLPLLAATLPSNLAADPEALSLAQGAASGLALVYTVAEETNDDCTPHASTMLSTILAYISANPLAEADATVLTGTSAALSGMMASIEVLYNEGIVTQARAQTAMADALAKLALLKPVVGFGLAVGEAVQTVESTKIATDTQRMSASVTQARRVGRAEAVLGDAGGGKGHPEGGARAGTGGGRSLLAMGAGTTGMPALSLAYGDVSIRTDPSTIGVAIPLLGCTTLPSGAQSCPPYSVSASVTRFLSLFNPWSYEADSSTIISPIVWLQLQPFGVAEDIPLTQVENEIFYTLKLTRIPDSGEDRYGRRRVAACVRRGGPDAQSSWTNEGCRESDRTTDVTGSEVRLTCACNFTGSIAVQDLPGGCDNKPYSTLLYDECRVCGGDNSTCRGCDGIVASGNKLDGCNICGGDNSSCAGCDGIPNSGKVFDWCGVCGGDNSTCTGCDGKTVHGAVTARTGLVPKAYDMCQSPTHPQGVCGGCGATCRGCDGVPNSGLEFDKCDKCGPYPNPTSSQYSVSSKDNCSLGLTSCASGFAPDSCAICQPLSGGTPNQACMGCDGVPRLFGRKTVDACGLCGGNDCTCTDCKGVVGGTAQYDRCGVCNGNNTCLDCAGLPYGTNLKDSCGICGGKNNTIQCTGCDGRIYPRPLVPPYLDAAYECCPASRIGCNGLCNATVGCDGNCSKTPLKVDKCGICGGQGLPNTGSCDCAGTPNGRASVGCDDQCRSPALVLDTCGVCGGTDKAETGHCDCAGVPYGPSLRDPASLCCTVADMGCDSLCFSGKTYDICGVCGGDGGTCLSTRPVGGASAVGPPPPYVLHFIAIAVAFLSAAIDDWTRGGRRH